MAKYLFDPSERFVGATCVDEQPDLAPGDIVHLPVRVADVTAYPLDDQHSRTFWLVGFKLDGELLTVNGYNVHVELDVDREGSSDG